jgi:hypothetical protein
MKDHDIVVNGAGRAAEAVTVGQIRSGLFAARPDLPQKVISALARDKVSGKSTALFGHLCAAATRQAFGAEHNLAGYRVERTEELDVAIGTPDFGQVVEDAHEDSLSGQVIRGLFLNCLSYCRP